MNLNLPESHRVWPGLNQSGSNGTEMDLGGSSGSSYHSAKLATSYPVMPQNLTAVDSTSLSTLTTALSHCSSVSTVKDSRYALARRLKRLLSDMSDCLLALFRRIYHRGHRRCKSASEDGSELVIPNRTGGELKTGRKTAGAHRHRRHYDSDNNSPLGSYETARSFGDVILTNSSDWPSRSRVLICPPADSGVAEVLGPGGICDLKPPPANYKRLKSRQRSSALSSASSYHSKRHLKVANFAYERCGAVAGREKSTVANLFGSRRSRKPKLGGDGKENLTADGTKIDGRRQGSSGSTNSSNSSSLQKSRSWDFSVCDTIGDAEFGLLVDLPPRMDIHEWLASHSKLLKADSAKCHA